MIQLVDVLPVCIPLPSVATPFLQSALRAHRGGRLSDRKRGASFTFCATV
jgi:hypothetical protein